MATMNWKVKMIGIVILFTPIAYAGIRLFMLIAPLVRH
jgi:hypothetical protein